jgi:cellulose biosynthesis protein BcsQ
MIIISLYNIKGGVGKTATAVNLAYLAAQDRRKVLLCDLDPQGSATYYFRIKARISSGVKPLLKGKKKLEQNIKGTDYKNLDLLPADFSLRKMDIILDNAKRSRRRLKESLDSLKSDYDYIFLDSPPNITLLSENIFYASDFILVPVIPTTLSSRTFQKLIDFFEKERIKEKKIIPFFSMVEKRKTMHQQSMAKLRGQYPFFLKTIVSYSSFVEKMGIYREPVGCFSPRSVPAGQYQLLWKEVKKQIHPQNLKI